MGGQWKEHWNPIPYVSQPLPDQLRGISGEPLQCQCPVPFNHRQHPTAHPPDGSQSCQHHQQHSPQLWLLGDGRQPGQGEQRILQWPGFAHGACHPAQQHGTSGPVLSAGPTLAAEQHSPLIGTLPMSWIVIASPQTAPCVWTLCYWSPQPQHFPNCGEYFLNIKQWSFPRACVLVRVCGCWRICLCVCKIHSSWEHVFFV